MACVTSLSLRHRLWPRLRPPAPQVARPSNVSSTSGLVQSLLRRPRLRCLHSVSLKPVPPNQISRSRMSNQPPLYARKTSEPPFTRIPRLSSVRKPSSRRRHASLPRRMTRSLPATDTLQRFGTLQSCCGSFERGFGRIKEIFGTRKLAAPPRFCCEATQMACEEKEKAV